ncbi:GNAT family N-acetyltransferase [Mycoplasmatota bacterium zrk1]
MRNILLIIVRNENYFTRGDAIIMNELVIRKTKREDSKILFDFIVKLATHEKLAHEVVATISDIESNIFDNRYAEAIIFEVDQKPIGIAIYFYMFSTFYAKPTLYLEDLFILEEHRSKGYGTKALEYLNELAISRKCVRFEWSCLDWNTSSIVFYEKLGAKQMKEWIRFRLTEEGMKNL